jgi:hypothetical protein
MNKSPQEQLWEYAQRADTKKLEELLQMGKAVKGITYFNLGEIFDYIQHNHDQARSMAALTAHAYINAGKSTGYLFGLHTGMLTTLYLGAFQNNPKHSRECGEFHKLLLTCVSDLNHLIAEFYQQFKDQIPSE